MDAAKYSEERVGSTPTLTTKCANDVPITNSILGYAKIYISRKFGPLAQLARAPVLHTGGHGFESHRVHSKDNIQVSPAGPNHPTKDESDFH